MRLSATAGGGATGPADGGQAATPAGGGGGETGKPPGLPPTFDDFERGRAAERIYDAATKSVPDDLRAAIDAYVGDRFSEINRLLAYGESPGNLAEVRDLIRRIDLAFDEQGKTSTGTVLYRSERRGRMTEQWLGAGRGDIVQHLRYISTSTSDEVPGGEYAGPIRLEVMVPPGARAINVRRLSTHRTAAHEFEIILPRASEFRVLAKRKVGEIASLQVELVL